MRRTITYLLYSLMGAQIGFGVVYVAANFWREQRFEENMASLLPMGAISLMQLFVAGVSTWYFLGKIGFRERNYVRGYVCAFLLTVPYLLQMHLARLVWSLSLSVFLWLLGLILDIRSEGFSKKKAALLLAAYFLYGILCPDGLWLGGVLAFAASFGVIGKKAAFRWMTLLVAAAIFFANMGLNDAFPKERRIYRENTLGAAVMSRLVWPNVATNYYFWNDDIKAVLSEEDVLLMCLRIDLLEKQFYPALQEAYGDKKATKLCLELGYLRLKEKGVKAVLSICRDFMDYLLLPFTIEKNLRGKGVSLTAWNYGRMKEHTPLLVKYYYRYGAFELPFFVLGSLFLWGFRKNERLKAWKMLFFATFWYALWYAVRSNLPIDYKPALPILFLWYLVSVGGLLCQKVENEAKAPM